MKPMIRRMLSHKGMPTNGNSRGVGGSALFLEKYLTSDLFD
jgi:hypothetical protein